MNRSAFKAMNTWRNIGHVATQTAILGLSVSHCAFFQQVTRIPPASGGTRR